MLIQLLLMLMEAYLLVDQIKLYYEMLNNNGAIKYNSSKYNLIQISAIAFSPNNKILASSYNTEVIKL